MYSAIISILFILFLSAFIMFIPKKYYTYTKKKRKILPREFVVEFNRLLVRLDKMTIENTQAVRYEIDDLIFKYHMELDYDDFTEKMAILINSYREKNSKFLLNDQLN